MQKPKITRSLDNHKPKIGWILTGDYYFASSRLQGYLIHENFLKSGLDSKIVASNFGFLESGYSVDLFLIFRKIVAGRFDIVFFQKPGWMMFKLSEMLRLQGVKTIAIQCDPFSGEYNKYFDSTIVTTAEIGRQLGIIDAIVIDDMVEVPEGVCKSIYVSKSDRLRIVWVGQGTGPSGKNFILPFLDKLSNDSRLIGAVEIVTISRGSWAAKEWSIDTVHGLICDCDLAIIPMSGDKSSKAKSSNRLTMFMALGMPTVVSPIPSYIEVAHHNENAYIANDYEQFVQAILFFMDEGQRRKIGMAARALVSEAYSQDVVTKRWMAAVKYTLDKPIHRPISSNLTRFISNMVRLVSRF